MKLSDKTCKAALAKDKVYKLFDGGGLYLEVKPNERKYWRMKYRYGKKENVMMIGEFEQRPVYKANVQNFITIRQVQPKISKEILRKLPIYFPTPSHEFKLDPTYEKDRGEETENLKNIPYDEDKFAIFRDLQKLCNQGLVKPSQHEHMWHSAVHSGGCKLTATGAHYRYLAAKKKI